MHVKHQVILAPNNSAGFRARAKETWLEVGCVLRPTAVVRHFYAQGYLIRQLTRRQVLVQYRGSLLGLLWSVINPLFMLMVYTLIFAGVFHARWNGGPASRMDYALTLFISLISFNLFSQSVSASPGLILGNVNYVKRVVFPLEILPIARFGACCVDFCISFSVYLLAMLVLRHAIPWTMVFLPIVLMPLLLLALGCSFLLASLGVFLRDVQSIVTLFMMILMFLSTVFYPLASLPIGWQHLARINPLVTVMENIRRVTMLGQPPEWGHWLAVTIVGAGVAAGGLAAFMKLKGAFADVI